MSFRDEFIQPEYEDAPHLSDQLLLPNLVVGHTVYLASAFASSYVFKLVRDLAASDEIEPGKLSLTFYVPGDLQLKSVGITRFKSYLRRYAENELQVAQFVADCLQLFSEEGNDFSLQIAHTSGSTPLVRGCVGIIVSAEDVDNPINADYVAFVDSKGGDYNSPVKPLLSWDDEQKFDARELLQKVAPVINGTAKKGWLVSDDEAISWLEYLDDWYAENLQVESDDEDEDVDDDELDAELLNHLQALDEFENEGDFDWVDDDSPYEFDLSKHFSHFRTEFSPRELEMGHVPPLPVNLTTSYGHQGAKCPACGEVFYRADGCPSVDWNYRPDWT
jgi:hypothetical protein